jgi:Ni,Fe-hydrogenase III small subunit
MRRLLLSLALFGSLLLVLAPITIFAQAAPSCDFSNYPNSFSCSVPTSTPVPTDTAVPTDTPAPTATVTATVTLTLIPPTLTLTSTPVPVPAVLSIAGVPLCGIPQASGQVFGPIHDPTRWHALVERNPNNSILCTYGHEHGSDPHVLDSLFGTLPASATGQEIAFAWLTGPKENSTDPSSLSHQPFDNRPVINGKHTFFKWETLTPSKLAHAGINGCPPNPNELYGFDNIRLEVHADANAGADIRFHSFFVQAQECSTTDPTYHGQFSIGGWFDYGFLNGTHWGDKDVRVPLLVIDPCTPGDVLQNGATCQYHNSRRTHGASSPGPANSTDPNAILPGTIRNDFTWYGSNGDPDLIGQWSGPAISVSDGIREDDWGPVDPNNPSGPVLFYPGGSTTEHHNHGWGGIDILAFSPPRIRDFLADDPPVVNSDGSYSWKGWVDVRGRIQTLSACLTAASLGPSTTCIPTVLTNVRPRPGNAQFSNDISHVPTEYEDVVVNGQSLIGYPN